MTHAFFKALLFMAAPVIAAMAKSQDIDRMGGFRRAMPFTSATDRRRPGLAGFPGTAGFFSKDEILTFAEARGGCTGISPSGGLPWGDADRLLRLRSSSASSTASPARRRRSPEQGQMPHGEPINPATGEREDYERLPAEEHHIAEREWPM